MSIQDDCGEIRTWIFDFREDHVALEQKQKVMAHLALCAACRDEDASERALTALLQTKASKPQRRHRPIKLALALAAAAVLLVFLFPPQFGPEAEAALGSLTRYHLATAQMSDGRQQGPVKGTRELRAMERIEIGEGAFVAIELKGTAKLMLSGPAVLDLDHRSGRWNLALWEGGLKLEVEAGAKLALKSLDTSKVYEAGHYLLGNLANKNMGVSGLKGGITPEEVRRRALELFYEQDGYAAAAPLFLQVANDPQVKTSIRRHCLIMYQACFSNQELHQLAVAVGIQFIAEYPEDEALDYVLYFTGLNAWKQSNRKKTPVYWQRIFKEFPKSQWAAYALGLIGEVEVDDKSSKTERQVFYDHLKVNPKQPGGYLVVAIGLDTKKEQDRGFAKVAKAIAKFHKTSVVSIALGDLRGLEAELRQRFPKEVAFVVPPAHMDVNLHRQILMMTQGLDHDILPDFSFGYFCARDTKQLWALWQRNKIALSDEALSSASGRTWISTAVTSSAKAMVLPQVWPTVKAAGFSGKRIYWAIEKGDNRALEFVDQHLKELENADVIAMTGNGDPMGIWLFDDKRNADRSKHWDFDPKKVGLDPDGAMTRIRASRFAALKLKSPVVWSGTCHSAAVESVFVEGDIVATFGRTKTATRYRMKPEDSMCLALIEAGALALLCPIAANHGANCSMEQDSALERGLNLGEAIKSTYDDLFMAAQKPIVLGIQIDGQPSSDPEYIMQGGGANRLLIGDPALKPFKASTTSNETVVVTKLSPKSFEVKVSWLKGYHARGWDIFRDASQSKIGRDRLGARVNLAKLLPPGTEFSFEVTLTAKGSDGKALPYALTHCIAEDFHGEQFLHLQANGHKSEVGGKEVEATFLVTIEVLK